MTSAPDSLRTNRHLYRFVIELCQRNADNKRTLEEYLRALLGLATREREQADLPAPLFAAMLEAAFHEAPLPYDPSWAAAWQPRKRDDSDDGFPGWEALIQRQIVDLREMHASGALEDKQRYFGIDSPRGARWYNFDPTTYLECAAAGSFDGWTPPEGQELDDSDLSDVEMPDEEEPPEAAPTSSRRLVPGPVAVLGPDGKVVVVDPSQIESAHFELSRISWEDLRDFLVCGQIYE